MTLHNSIFDYCIDKLQILRCRGLNNQYVTCNYETTLQRNSAMITQTLNEEISKKTWEIKKMIINNIESIHANSKHEDMLQIFTLQEMHQSAEVSHAEKSSKTRIIINYKEETIIKSEHKIKNSEQRLT